MTEIQAELKRLNRLINDISSTSRLDAELARQEMQRIDIRTVLENVNGLFTDMLSDDGRQISLACGTGNSIVVYGPRQRRALGPGLHESYRKRSLLLARRRNNHRSRAAER